MHPDIILVVDTHDRDDYRPDVSVTDYNDELPVIFHQVQTPINQFNNPESLWPDS